MELIILGYHRSGTSAVAQYLSKCGLFLGDQLLGAQPSNPMGHFEDVEIVDFHQSMLVRQYEMWLLKAPFVPVIEASDIETARRIVASRTANHAIWGFKDPRSCLYVSLWKLACPNPRWIVPLRHYMHCIDSVIRRAIKDASQPGTPGTIALHKKIASSPDWIAQSWLQYMRRVLSVVEKDRDNAFVFMMEHDIANTSPSMKINKKFGTDLRELNLSTTYDANLFQNTSEHIYALDGELEEALNDVWDRLCDLIGEE